MPRLCADAALWVLVGYSSTVRGHQTAELLEQHTPTRSDDTEIETLSCAEACGAAAQARFDLFLAGRESCGARRLLLTHVKYACRCLLRSRPGLAAGVPQGDGYRNVFHLLDAVPSGWQCSLLRRQLGASVRRRLCVCVCVFGTGATSDVQHPEADGP